MVLYSRLVTTLLVVGGFLLGVDGASAQASNLQTSPQHLEVADIMEVQYTPIAHLQGKPRLILRGRIHSMPGKRLPDLLTLADLTAERDGVYRGSFRLPESAVYAVLAVEDTSGDHLDAGGETWEILVHGPDGRPLRYALQSKIQDMAARNSLQAAQTARQLAALYPEHLDSWVRLFYAEREIATGDEVARLQESHRARLAEWLARQESTSPESAEEAATVVYYARALGDTVTAGLWRGRLLEDHPDHPASVQERLSALAVEYRDNPVGLLAAYEPVWEQMKEDGMPLAFAAFRLAQQVRDPSLIRRWAEHLQTADASFLPMVARVTLQIPELRAYGMDRARRQLVRLEQPQDAERPLTQTRSEQRQIHRRATGIFLGELGAALLAEGHPAAALDTLERAVETTWSPSLFRSIAETRLTLGDTTAAGRLFARVAADPETPIAYSDSVAVRLGRHFASAEWQAETRSARAEMRRAVWSSAIERTPSSTVVELVDGTGARVPLATTGNEPMVLAFWSRYCSSSRSQLDQLERVAAQLVAQGIRVATITLEAPSSAVQAFLAEHGYTFPVLYDIDQEAQRTFDSHRTPTYLVLDSAGRVRFQRNALDEVVRQALVLSEAEAVAEGGAP
jgi:peroxiredoxin